MTSIRTYLRESNSFENATNVQAVLVGLLANDTSLNYEGGGERGARITSHTARLLYMKHTVSLPNEELGRPNFKFRRARVCATRIDSQANSGKLDDD